jgi:protocatechuate 3,4-dioxygenase beta subunit
MIQTFRIAPTSNEASMRSSRAFLITAFALGFAVSALAQGGAPGAGGFRQGGQFPRGGRTGPRDATPQPTGTAVLRGRIVGGDSGGPLRHALVRLSGVDMREGKMATTDEQGKWEIRDLPAGRVELTASKAGYVSLHYGQRRPFEQGRPLELADAQVVENVNFNLPKGSVITGRINDEFGDPVAEVMVMALRYRYFNGQRRLVPAGRLGQTDDGGNFRIFGLAPGDYYLSATLREGMVGENDPTNRSGYAPTYYPGTGSSQQAERVTVGLGGEVSGVSFALLPVRTAKITGTAIDSQGKPMTGAFVTLMESSEGGEGTFMMSFGGGARVGEGGHFTLNNVSPGDYTISAREMGPGREGDAETAETRITVGGEDIAGVSLIGTKGSIIRGSVSFDTQPTSGSVLPSSTTVMAIAKSPDASPMFRFRGGARDSLNEDWTFEVRAMTAPVLLRPMRTPPGYVLKGVFMGAQDVTDTGLNFKPGETITGVQVVLTTKTTSVNGTVTDDKGQPVTDYAAVIFAEDSAKWGFMSRYITMARPDQQGAFQARQLPPGRYLAIALDYIEDGEQTNPETLERLRGSATSFDLGDADQKALALKVVKAY